MVNLDLFKPDVERDDREVIKEIVQRVAQCEGRNLDIDKDA